MEITNVEQLKSVISAAAGESLMMTVSRNNKLISTVITPQLSAESNSTKIGAWVKDAASGIGTLTFYDPDTKVFAALGHSINDPETAQIIDIKDGSIFSSAIVSVEKSQKGQPGELKGVFT